MSEEFHKITHLHQVFIVDGYKTPKKLPPSLEYHKEIARKLYPHAMYKLWGGDDLRRFLKENFSSDVLDAFDTLKPYSYKCDLARYCLMYVYGGIYFDLAIRMEHEWRIPLQYGVAAFTEIYDGMDCWACVQTSLLWSLPKRREWYLAIRQIVENCQNKFYGPHDHYPTAGALLGHSFAAAMSEKGQEPEADDQFVGEVRYVTPDRTNQNVTYVSPLRDLVGMRNKIQAGDISALGVSGSNNYCQIWKAKQVYHESKHIWLANDKNIVIDSVGKKENGYIYIPKRKGRVFYGPYVDFSKGHYKITLNFTERTKYKKIFLDIAKEGGETIREFEYNHHENTEREEEVFFFNLEKNEKSLEFRMKVFGDFEGGVTSIVVEEVKELEWRMNHPTIVNDQVGVLSNKGITLKQGDAGRVFYGPFVDLPPGAYSLEFIFDKGTSYRNLECEVKFGFSEEVLDKLKVSNNRIVNKEKEKFEFYLYNSKSFVEFCLFVLGDFSGRILSIKLTRQDLPGWKKVSNKLDNIFVGKE
ncbi:hypothetical protein NQF86_02940 [Bombella sp. TMW 2.2543]|uniref:Heparin-sulfate lyase N-terminal domain-containing protein n=1 Tax=Bombella pluederhausensis TaxID=2967336 RepID=A0ABT3WH04_9PROT|nr:glycosyltransferase [Bombella pluederhausensis]MCX5617629.1 hypothetical protein [Bombella pluederhausensis]